MLRRSSAPLPRDSPRATRTTWRRPGIGSRRSRSILEEPADEAVRLRRDSCSTRRHRSTSGTRGRGAMWIDAVNDIIDQTFARLAPDTSVPLTFTSRSATIPLRMGDPGERVLNVKVELASGQGRVPRWLRATRAVGSSQSGDHVPSRGEGGRVRARSTSTSIAPNGAILTRRELLVSSTAVNPIALIITIGAGLVLVGLWSRRLFRRRNP